MNSIHISVLRGGILGYRPELVNRATRPRHNEPSRTTCCCCCDPRPGADKDGAIGRDRLVPSRGARLDYGRAASTIGREPGVRKLVISMGFCARECSRYEGSAR